MPSTTKAGSKPGDKEAQKISLKGSAKEVTEFFQYAINNLLYQRGVYPPEDFGPYVELPWQSERMLTRVQSEEVWAKHGTRGTIASLLMRSAY